MYQNSDLYSTKSSKNLERLKLHTVRSKGNMQIVDVKIVRKSKLYSECERG